MTESGIDLLPKENRAMQIFTGVRWYIVDGKGDIFRTEINPDGTTACWELVYIEKPQNESINKH